jgi:hypothetical protein
VKPALENIKKYARIYPLSEAGKPHEPVQNKNGSYVQLNTIPPSTYLFYEYLNNVVQAEPAGSYGPELKRRVGFRFARTFQVSGWQARAGILRQALGVSPGMQLIL